VTPGRRESRKLPVRNWLHLRRDVLTKIANTDSSGRAKMKAFIAALIAGAILYVVDAQYNDGHYAEVVKLAATSLIGR
jgi:hypothetical protein